MPCLAYGVLYIYTKVYKRGRGEVDYIRIKCRLLYILLKHQIYPANRKRSNTIIWQRKIKSCRFEVVNFICFVVTVCISTKCICIKR